MKRTKFSLLMLSLTLGSNLLMGQNIQLELANPQPDLVDVYGGNFASGDIDGDGDADLLLTGQGASGINTKLYINDGAGTFTEKPTILTNVTDGSLILEDLDNDGDLDVFLAGSQSGLSFTEVYINNGMGSFTVRGNPGVPQFKDGDAAIADVNNDGFKDIIIAYNLNTDVYLNNGTGFFAPQQSNVFTSVRNSSLAFIDIENDGDADVLISGKDANDNQVFELYSNNGQGVFSLNTNSNFTQMLADDIDVADTDGDGDMDFVTSGQAGSTPSTFLYTNNGSGIFTITPTSLQQTFAGKNTFSDLDNDGDEDLLIVGSQQGGLPNIYNIVYQNEGNNVFVPSDTLGGEYIASCVADDFNGDGLNDVIIQGFVERTNVYWNTPIVTSVNKLNKKQEGFTCFPNPTNGTLNINLKQNDFSQLRVTDINGSILQTRKLDKNSLNYTLNLNDYPNGVYFIQLSNNSLANSFKVIKH